MDTLALSKLTQGLYILGSQEEKRYVGCVVDAVIQVASKPLVIAVACMKTGYTQSCIQKNNLFSLSVLGQHVDPFVIGNFGYQSSQRVDKWNNVPFFVKENLPFYQDAIAFFSCKVIATHEFDSHILFMAEITDAWQQGTDSCLTYGEYQNTFKIKVMEAFSQYKKEGEKK